MFWLRSFHSESGFRLVHFHYIQLNRFSYFFLALLLKYSHGNESQKLWFSILYKHLYMNIHKTQLAQNLIFQWKIFHAYDFTSIFKHFRFFECFHHFLQISLQCNPIENNILYKNIHRYSKKHSVIECHCP